MTTREHLGRAMWTLFEPIHAVTYFSTQAREAFAKVGLTRYWDGYFAGRSAPLGAISGSPVTAIFSGFSPAIVDRALPAAWSVASPAQVLEARLRGAEATLRELIPDEAQVVDATAALVPVARRIDAIGRPLAAANRALLVEEDPYRQLWQATATLREHRGDGHVIALVAGGIAGLSTLILRSGVDLDAPTMQRARGWSDEQWATETERQISLGNLGDERRITAQGAAALNSAEELTNQLAVSPWEDLSDDELVSTAALLAPIAHALADLYPQPNPIGMPEPWHPAADPTASRVPAAPVLG
jgi:hypothetical protein